MMFLGSGPVSCHRATHTYLLHNLLVSRFFTVKQQLLGRSVNFVKQLMRSVARCARSNTRKNLINIQQGSKHDPLTTPSHGGLEKLLKAKISIEVECQEVDDLSTLIDRLCTT